MERLEGRVAVVTGAASGIGLGLATRFAEEGMKVVLADIEAPALEAAVAGLKQRQLDVTGVFTDVSKYESVVALEKKAVEAYGKVHVLCNNAGVGGGALIWDTTDADWRWTLGVNLWGVINGLRAFLPRMMHHGEEGHIVNTASLAGITSPTVDSIYAASKHAVVAISEALFFQLHVMGTKLSASVLCPGFVRTNILDSARNRPAELENPSAALPVGVEEMTKMMRQLIGGGLPPAEVAGMVVDAIRADKFWVLTAPEFDGAIRDRMESILQRRNPAVPAPRS
jgi:NAD(P)-dependent dehydrogenase (short-subunit alcohol dehydrogenase family)